MKRKMIMTIEGKDDSDKVDFKFDFLPPLGKDEDVPASAWNACASKALDFFTVELPQMLKK